MVRRRTVAAPTRRKSVPSPQHGTKGVAKRLARLLTILRLTADGQGWSAKKLASQVGISERRLFHDLALLNHSGLRVVSDKDGYRSLYSNIALPVTLSVEEILVLLGPGLEDAKYRESAQIKLASALPSETAKLFRDSRRLSASIQVSGCAPEDQAHIDAAVRQRRKLCFKYQGLRDRKRRVRTVEPHGMFMKGSGWYLAAWCSEAAGMRLFRMDRIEAAQELTEKFEPRPEFKLEDLVGKGLGVWRGKAIQARIEVLPSHVTTMRSEAKANGMSFRQEGSRGILEITYGNIDALAWWLAQFGEGIRVLAPKELRARILKVGRSIVAHHSG